MMDDKRAGESVQTILQEELERQTQGISFDLSSVFDRDFLIHHMTLHRVISFFFLYVYMYFVLFCFRICIAEKQV